ncbi:hypothetical protein CPter291_2617 [Collimonas pratensis]|uniref:Uncharacterized protein n=1 Tax=Collimonas pratensis TaxID=279113 RepID=A0ABM5Z792_9BURK|nr:hypothetical protein CPter291_2617 [Collimonas pratensis]
MLFAIKTLTSLPESKSTTSHTQKENDKQLTLEKIKPWKLLA